MSCVKDKNKNTLADFGKRMKLIAHVTWSCAYLALIFIDRWQRTPCDQVIWHNLVQSEKTKDGVVRQNYLGKVLTCGGTVQSGRTDFTVSRLQPCAALCVGLEDSDLRSQWAL